MFLKRTIYYRIIYTAGLQNTSNLDIYDFRDPSYLTLNNTLGTKIPIVDPTGLNLIDLTPLTIISAQKTDVVNSVSDDL